MLLIARHHDREQRVEVDRRGALFVVRVGDNVYEVDVADGGHEVRSLIIGGSQFEVVTRAEAPGRYRVSAAGGTATVELSDLLTHLAQQSGRGRAQRRRQEVAAYMPGKVVAVLVAEGAEVRGGQGLVVLEAMKMQNEILAPNDGVVRRIAVQAGQAVDKGDLLFVIE